MEASKSTPVSVASAAVGDPVLLEVSELKGGYGRRPVLFDVSLRVAKGEIVAMFGPNGAGRRPR